MMTEIAMTALSARPPAECHGMSLYNTAWEQVNGGVNGAAQFNIGMAIQASTSHADCSTPEQMMHRW